MIWLSSIDFSRIFILLFLSANVIVVILVDKVYQMPVITIEID